MHQVERPFQLTGNVYVCITNILLNAYQSSVPRKVSSTNIDTTGYVLYIARPFDEARKPENAESLTSRPTCYHAGNWALSKIHINMRLKDNAHN